MKRSIIVARRHGRNQDQPIPELHEAGGVALALGFGVLALVFDQLCDMFKRREMKIPEALGDGAAHIATALAVAIPSSVYVRDRNRFVALAVASAVLIDLDHLVAARSTKLIPCMTMPNRPASHSVLTVVIASVAVERLMPGKQSGLAMVLGLGSHLLRDLATGGAPLFLPRRIIEVPRPPVALMMFALGFFGRWYSRNLLNTSSRRRWNPPNWRVLQTREPRQTRRGARGNVA